MPTSEALLLPTSCGDDPFTGSSNCFWRRAGLGLRLLTEPVEQVLLDEYPPSSHLAPRQGAGTCKAVEVGDAAVQQRGSAGAV